MAKKNPLTASERRGIIVVAAISLLITGAGMVVSRCDRPDPEELERNAPRVEVLLSADSLQANDTVTQKNRKTRGKGKTRGKKKSARTGKVRADSMYLTRNPLDETVSE